MKRKKLSQSKAPLTRKTLQENGNEDGVYVGNKNTTQDDSRSNVHVENNGSEENKTVSPKSKCYRQTSHIFDAMAYVAKASSTNDDDQSQTSAYDYNSDESTSIEDSELHLETKRKMGSSREGSTTSQCRYKKSQQALNLVKKLDKVEKKNVKKRKGRATEFSASSDEQDFDKPVKKSLRLLLPDTELLKFRHPTTHNENKKTMLNLKKVKRNVTTDELLSEESNTEQSTSDIGPIDQKKNFLKSTESSEDGYNERDDDDDDDEKDDICKPESHDNIRLQKTVEDKVEIRCPICSKEFAESVEQTKINEHVNSCLDGKRRTEVEIPDNLVCKTKNSLSMLQVQLVAFEYQRKENQEFDDVFGGEDGLFFCHLCQKDLSKMNLQRRRQHINKCCDKTEKPKEDKTTQPKRDDSKKGLFTCPFCNMDFKSTKPWQVHIKKCAQKNNVPTTQLLEIVKQQDELEQETESRQTEERTETILNEDMKRKPTQVKKKRKVENDLRNIDEETQLAMALSVSMAPPCIPENNDLTKKTKRKRKKGNEIIPALLLRSKEETQNVIAARAAQVICNKDEDCDEDSISCTPALAPSSLAEQFIKVKKANDNIVKEESKNVQATMKTNAALIQDVAKDESQIEVEKDHSLTSDISEKPLSSNCIDTTVLSLSDMLGSPDMCRSFLSFLDDVDEEAVEEAALEVSSEVFSKQTAKSIKAGQSAPLWSIASLNNKELSVSEFYVPGLLPVESPKRPKKTPRKCSNNKDLKLSTCTETKTSLVNKVLRKSEEMCESNQEKILDIGNETPNKTMSESEITSASQAVNLNILLELADSKNDDNDDDGDDTLNTPRKSSVDDDDDNVFPSSGFCLPVGPNNLKNEESQHSVPPSFSVFLQDMSKMVCNKSLSDVMIVTKGNNNIPAHSFMLATRSDVLANMISDARIMTCEQQIDDNHVYITFVDIEADAVRSVLQYIYTASVNVNKSCIDDVADLANRLKLFELVKACQESKTSLENKQNEQEADNKDEDKEGMFKDSISAEELLNVIWQDETGEFETIQNGQENSQDGCQEGFDDNDIEEVRIFHTQAVHKRKCSDDAFQETLEEMLYLDETFNKKQNEGKENLGESGSCNPDDGRLLLIDINDATSKRQPEKIESIEQATMTSIKETYHIQADISLLKVTDSKGTLKKQDFENTDTKDQENENNFESLETFVDDKHNNYDDKEGDFECNTETKFGSDNIGDCSPDNEIICPEVCDDKHTEGFRSDMDDVMSHQSMIDEVDLTEDDIYDNDKSKVAREYDDNTSQLQRHGFKSIEDDSDEHDGDVAILNQSISLLSDDNDENVGGSLQQIVASNDLIIPETPHPKSKTNRQATPEERNVKQSSLSSERYSPLSVFPTQFDRVSCDSSNSENDHVSEDKNTFLEKLKSKISAKANNSIKKKKKRKGVATKSRNNTKLCSKKNMKSYERNKRDSKDTNATKELEYPSTSNIDTAVDDLSFEYEIADLAKENCLKHAEVLSETKEMADLKGNNTVREKIRSHDDEERPWLSLSPPRMLSPRVPSPCYSDFDHEVPSPPVSPVSNVHSDVDMEESSSYSTVNHSPVSTPPVLQISTGLQDKDSSMSKVDSREGEGEGVRMEVGVSGDSCLRVHEEVIDSDPESENNGVVTLLTVLSDDKPEGEINETESIEGTRHKDMASTTRTFSNINAKTSLFKRLKASKYGLESTETEVSSDTESDASRGSYERSQTPSKDKVNDAMSTTASIPDHNDFYEDGGFNCDVNDFEACLDGDESFMADAAEQLQLTEKPDVQEGTDYQVQLSEPCTPAQRSAKGNDMQNPTIPSPITPMPDYDNMDTPDLKCEVQKFGIRPLPKKKMKSKLVEIYKYTHPGAKAQSQSKEDTSKNTTSSQATKGQSSKATRDSKRGTKTTKAPSSQPSRQPAKNKIKPASQVPKSSDSEDDGYSSIHRLSRLSSRVASSYKTNEDHQKELPVVIEDGSSSGSFSSQPTIKSDHMGNKFGTRGSVSDDDRNAGRSSDDSSYEEEEFGEVSVLVESEIVTASQQVDNDNLESKLLSYVENNQDMYLKVLNYQPIDLMALHEHIKANRIKCRVGELIDFLDEQCITFTTSGQKPQQRKKPSRRKR